MRPTGAVLLLLCQIASGAWAQAPLDVGTPQAAFAGGPIRLSSHAVALLREHYQGDKVPQIPEPFRDRLDTALAGRDWKQVAVVKQQLQDKDGPMPALMWEQTRFIATGSIGVVEMHALDIAATSSTGLSETAVMMWLYAAAVTMTDGEKCVDRSARDAHLARLHGLAFEPVLQIVRGIADDRLAAMRDLAIRLESALAPDRTDDTMCRMGTEQPEIKPDGIWRPEAARARTMLPRDLLALAAVVRAEPVRSNSPAVTNRKTAAQ
jgi:hypothetical protein